MYILTFCVVVTLLWICLPLAVRSLVTSFEMTIGSQLVSILAQKSGYKLLSYMLGIKVFVVCYKFSIWNADVNILGYPSIGLKYISFATKRTQRRLSRRMLTHLVSLISSS